jgi:hypothetical protein
MTAAYQFMIEHHGKPISSNNSDGSSGSDGARYSDVNMHQRAQQQQDWQKQAPWTPSGVPDMPRNHGGGLDRGGLWWMLEMYGHPDNAQPLGTFAPKMDDWDIPKTEKKPSKTATSSGGSNITTEGVAAEEAEEEEDDPDSYAAMSKLRAAAAKAKKAYK